MNFARTEEGVTTERIGTQTVGPFPGLCQIRDKQTEIMLMRRFVVQNDLQEEVSGNETESRKRFTLTPKFNVHRYHNLQI